MYKNIYKSKQKTELLIAYSSWNYEYVKGSWASAEFVLSKTYASIFPEFFFITILKKPWEWDF